MNIGYLPSAIRSKANLALKRIRHTGGPVDAQAAAEAHGIAVRYADFDDDAPLRVQSILGGFYDAEENMIIINRDLGAAEQNYAVAIEMGKALLHPEWCRTEDYQLTTRGGPHAEELIQEKDAHVFARALLAPQEDLKRLYPKIQIDELSQIFVLPRYALIEEVNRLS